jgi:hypothetical protein
MNTSPELAGTPTAPTPASGTNNTQIATTAFVKASGVDLTTNQTIAGTKTFSSDLKVNGLTIGKGASAMSQNTAIGVNALYSNNFSGKWNTAIGDHALYSNTGAEDNTAIGASALRGNITGNDNTATGSYALRFNTTGAGNIGIGNSTLMNTSTSSNNTAVGFYSGYNLSSGDNNTFIGFSAQPSTITVSNEITLGNESINKLRAQVTSITALSDRRDKTNIIPIGEGLAFLKKLNPVSFTWNTRDKAKVGIKSAGFIAQELLALQKQSTIGDHLDLVSENNPEKLEARYGDLLPVIVKAIQEESAEKDKEIKDLKTIVNNQQKQIDELKKMVESMLKK